MPFELLSKEEKKKYTQAGKVRVYKMLIPLEEFKTLDKERRREFLEAYLKDHTKAELREAWGISDIYYYLSQCGLIDRDPNKQRLTQKKRTAVLLEQEREQIAAAKEKLENDVIEAFTAAEEAKKEAESLRNELNITKLYFKQTIDEIKSFYETGMKTTHIMLEEQQKETAALLEELAQTKTALEEEAKNVEFLTDELSKVTIENDDKFSRLESKVNNVSNFNSVPQQIIPNNNSELLNRMKTMEIDVTLLKQLAIR
jgi:hypothetical protein